MSIAIIADTASDITPKEAEELGIFLIPLTVTFGSTGYRDGYELTHEQFFEKLIECDTLPKTSQITPFEYEAAYTSALEHADEVVCIVLSSKLSGCYASAMSAASQFDGKVHVVDSENAALGEGILVELAIRLRANGMTAAEIEDELNREKKNIRLIALLDTLEYLKKGGRISPTVAFAGTVLGIKPVIAIENGEVALLGKARGSKNGSNKLQELIRNSGGIRFDMPITLAYSGLSRDTLDIYIRDSAELYKGYNGELPVRSIGSTIGTHVGPGAIAAAFFVD